MRQSLLYFSVFVCLSETTFIPGSELFASDYLTGLNCSLRYIGPAVKSIGEDTDALSNLTTAFLSGGSALLVN